MYPARKLSALTARKAALQRNIQMRGEQCAAGGTVVVRPRAWLDRVLVSWRQLAPLAQRLAAPPGTLAARVPLPRRKSMRSFVRWSPIAVRAMKVLFTLLKTQGRSLP
jgi:hypothetical protein